MAVQPIMPKKVFKVLKVGHGFINGVKSWETITDDKGNIVDYTYNLPTDLEKAKKVYKETADFVTNQYIKEQLAKYQEDLADIASEYHQKLQRLSRYITKSATIESQWNLIKVLATIDKVASGELDAQQAEQSVNEVLQELPETDRTAVQKLILRLYELAVILNWKEQIWEIEEQYEAEVDACTSFEELFKLPEPADVVSRYSELNL